jgi:hypothetical protein
VSSGLWFPDDMDDAIQQHDLEIFQVDRTYITLTDAPDQFSVKLLTFPLTPIKSDISWKCRLSAAHN